VLRGLLTDAECDYLIRKAEPDLKRSFTVDFSTGRHKETKVRTSDDTEFARRADPTIAAIEEKVARVTMIPERNGEGLHILRYKESQKFMPHFDYFHDLNSSRAVFGGQRAATVLMYLATPEEGGETVFPQAQVPPGLDSKGFSPCAQGKLAVRPRKGDALLFFSLLPDGTRDPTSMHGSCPVLKGLKYSATRWMRAHPHEGGPRRKSPGKAPVVQSPAHEARLPSDGIDGCVDTHEDCAFWQENGQCEANPAYMTRHCAGSCKACLKKGEGG
jgi:prolyl 4-hydroxylase